jgi:hypothetical protein
MLCWVVGVAVFAASVSGPREAKADPPLATAATEPSRKTIALGAAGVAIAGIVGTTVFGVLALHDKSDFDRTPTYALADNGANFAAYSDGCLALAVAAGVTSLVLWLTGAPPAEASPAGSPVDTPARSTSPTALVTTLGGGALVRF